MHPFREAGISPQMPYDVTCQIDRYAPRTRLADVATYIKGIVQYAERDSREERIDHYHYHTRQQNADSR